MLYVFCGCSSSQNHSVEINTTILNDVHECLSGQNSHSGMLGFIADKMYRVRQFAQWILASLVIRCCVAQYGTLIHAVEDTVGAENFTYYTYTEKGPVVLVLDSISG